MQYTIQPTQDAREAMREHRLEQIVYLRRFALFCLVAAVTLTVYYFRTDILDYYTQSQARAQLEQKQAYASSRIYFEPDSSNLFSLYGSNLAVLNKGTYKLYKPSGEQELGLQLGCSRPGMSVSDKYVMLFDRGNKTITVTDHNSTVATLEMSGAVVSVSQSDDGLVAVVHGDDRYRSIVSVYDNQQQLIYEWKTSEFYLSDAVLSPDGRYMSVVALTQDSGDFFSKIVLFSLDSEEPRASYNLPNTVAAAIYYLDNETICVVGDNCAIVLDMDGQELCLYDYGIYMLKTCAAGDGFVVLAMLNRSSGLGSKLILLNGLSQTPIERKTEDEVRRISASGEYIAVLYTSSIEMLGSTLNPYGQPVEVGSVQNILVHPDGLILTVYSAEAGYIDIITPFQALDDKKAAQGN